MAIETSLSLRLVFSLPLRQAEGFLGSVFKRMDAALPVPDHTTLSRRNRTLAVRRRIESLPKGPISFIVDTSGLKVCGQGEWHSRKHGEKRRRRWKKLHIGVDENGWILASNITDGHEQDPAQAPELLGQVEQDIKRFVGDGIYDQDPVYEAVEQHSPGARVIIPPRKDAVLSKEAGSCPWQRDHHIESIRREGLSAWKRSSDDYLQSHAENVFFRYKVTFGGNLRAKKHQAQEREVTIACALLNRMRAMGRPLSYPVA